MPCEETTEGDEVPVMGGSNDIAGDESPQDVVMN
jgi:hypothetical protein